MGLDQYLKKRKYLGLHYREIDTTKINHFVINDEVHDLENLQELIYHVYSWRKSNQIHNFFVENVQEGQDDCKEYYVQPSILEDLLHDCKKVLANHTLAEDILPSTEGFFFGGTDYDTYYYKDLEDTVEMLESLMLKPDWKTYNYYYQSSW